MPKLKAILFDYDGTIRDTEHIIIESLHHAFLTHAVEPVSKEVMAPYIHHHNFVRDEFASHIDPELFDQVYYAKKHSLLPTITLFDGAKDALQELHTKYKIGLVTAAKTTELDLERLGIEQYFDVIVGGDELAYHKPHPEGLLLATNRLGIAPSEAAYVGDMPTDMQAGRAANYALTIGVSYGFASTDTLLQAGADYVVDSLGDIAAAIAGLSKAENDEVRRR